MFRSFRSILFLLLLVAAWLMPSAPAQAQAGMTGRALPVCVARAVPGMSAAALFKARGRFDCMTRQTGFGSGDFWLLSAPVVYHDSANRPVAVRYSSLWQKRATLYALYADGHIARHEINDRAAAGSVQLGAIIERRLMPRGVPVRQLLWHIEGSANLRGILNGARIATPTESARSNTLMAGFYAGFLGLCIALLMHNIALWQAMRHRFQVAYIAMILVLMLYTVSSSGWLVWMFGGIANTTRLRVNYLSLGLSAASAMLFARYFFEERIFAGWLGRVSTVSVGLIVLSSLAFATLAPWQIRFLDTFYSLSFLSLIGCVLPILWQAWRLQSNYLWLFAFAWGAPVAFAALRVAHNILPLGWSFWLDNSTLVSMTAEALLSSMAIAYRVRLLAAERDEAHVQEIAARLLADTDPLTGLLNRRAFLREAIGRGGNQVLLIADIDYFKRVNDTIGHDGGDEVLRRFARTLRTLLPEDALLARIGGEEFAIVASRANAPEPDAILASLRAERMPFDLTITASIGGSSGPLVTESDWKALYKAADRALFDAKEGGRDRSRLARGGWAIAA